MPERLPRAEWGAGDGGGGESPPAGKGAARGRDWGAAVGAIGGVPAVGQSLFAAGTDGFIRKAPPPPPPYCCPYPCPYCTLPLLTTASLLC